MMKFDTQDGLVCTARGSELEGLTLSGWKLVFSYQETVHEPCQEQEPIELNTSNNNGYYNNGCSTVSVTRYKPNTTTLFVLHKTEGSALESMQAQLQDKEIALCNQTCEIDRLVKELTDAQKQTEIEKSTSSRRLEDIRRVESERDRFRSTSTKLEADLAKIRKAIGERAFNEILPAPEEPAKTPTR